MKLKDIPGNFTLAESPDPGGSTNVAVGAIQFLLHIYPGYIKRELLLHGTQLFNVYSHIRFTHHL
jgi:hypothetical protein